VNDRISPATTSQLGGIIAERLPHAFDVIEQSNFAPDELAYPDGHRIPGTHVPVEEPTARWG